MGAAFPQGTQPLREVELGEFDCIYPTLQGGVLGCREAPRYHYWVGKLSGKLEMWEAGAGLGSPDL